MRHLLLAVTIAGMGLMATQTDGQEKGVETILHKVAAEDIAKEFADNPQKAEKKYDPNPPKGGAGGAIIQITSVLDKAEKKLIYLKTNSKVSVVLQVKEAKDELKGNLLITGTGKLVEFKNNRVLIEVGEVKVEQIRGDDKK